MELLTVPANFIDRAWTDGASFLAKACDTSGGEITGDQLKMILSRGERTLLKMQDGEKTVGWGVVRIDQLPNMRVLFITDLVAPHGHFERFFGDIKALAASLGCSRVRCAAGPAQARLYAMKCDFKPVYTILEVLT
ncbi:MAG: hypothetical protein EOO23_01720 [Comamonadaceae bacterium]|nr:MAG: hypothetical protein EOO23_01720 [Comamonadaceae bacterium]